MRNLENEAIKAGFTEPQAKLLQTMSRKTKESVVSIVQDELNFRSRRGRGRNSQLGYLALAFAVGILAGIIGSGL